MEDKAEKMETTEAAETTTASDVCEAELEALPSKCRSLRKRSICKRIETERNKHLPRPRKGRERPAPLSKYRRKAANTRERERMHEYNVAFEKLKTSIPHHKLKQIDEKKDTKITTLRCAIAYINTLSDLIEDLNRGNAVSPEYYYTDAQLGIESDDAKKKKKKKGKSKKSSSTKKGGSSPAINKRDKRPSHKCLSNRTKSHSSRAPKPRIVMTTTPTGILSTLTDTSCAMPTAVAVLPSFPPPKPVPPGIVAIRVPLPRSPPPPLLSTTTTTTATQTSAGGGTGSVVPQNFFIQDAAAPQPIPPQLNVVSASGGGKLPLPSVAAPAPSTSPTLSFSSSGSAASPSPSLSSNSSLTMYPALADGGGGPLKPWNNNSQNSSKVLVEDIPDLDCFVGQSSDLSAIQEFLDSVGGCGGVSQ